MNKTKTIYFLSAIVCIIGCYALNLSYSLFVQTEEKPVVDATVPSLSYSLETSEFSIPANSKQIIELKVINSGTSDIKYGILLESENLSEDSKLQLVNGSNDIIGETKSEEISVIKIYVENNDTSNILNLKFKVEAMYSTLNLDEAKYTDNTIIIREPKYGLTLATQLLDLDTRIVKNDSTPNLYDVEYNEVGMYKTSDDYGTSWYFRGSQQYNYVKFANQIWRIVRINGNNTIRMILQNPLSDKSPFNDISSNDLDNAHVGYMFGTIDSDTYELTHKNVNNSTIKNVVDNFYETVIENQEQNIHYEKYLADTLFCGDKSLSTNTALYEEYAGDYGSPSTAGKSNYYTYYKGFERLIYGRNHASLSPSLKCAENDDYNYSRYTAGDKAGTDRFDMNTTTSTGVSINNDLTYPIALLSADELLFAGADSLTANLGFYLTISDDWWTMTPRNFSGGYPHVFTWQENGNLPSIYYGDINTEMFVRPVINLREDLPILDGNGTSDNPYIVAEEDLTV